MSEEHQRLEATVHGLVQGVYYRASCRDEARKLGLHGWVRNDPAGTVTLVAEGDRDALEQLRKWCEHGPPAARVDKVDTTWSDAQGGLRPFEVRR